jgi:hypothetical protein
VVAVDASYREAVLDAITTGQVSARLFEAPKNEASALFVEMVTRLQREFVLNPEHGLDSYLSLRIRHGTLSGTLRSAPEAERIVTKRASEGQGYKSNDHWRDLLNMSPSAWVGVDERLAQFSRDLDDFIAELNARYVQVLREDKPEGLFRVAVSPVSIYTMASDLKPEVELEGFVSAALNLFWDVLEEDLLSARRLLDTEIRGRQRKLYDDLESELRQDLNLIPLADAIIRAKGQADLSIDVVRDWFERSAPSDQLILDMNELVDISLEAIKRFHPDFSPVVVAGRFDAPPLLGALNLFSDIFFVIF